MTLRCYVVDDEEHALDTVSKYIRQTPGLELAGTNTNPLAALDEITTRDRDIDIVFLDIDMPELPGITLAGLLNDLVSIIFTTAHPQHAVSAFDTGAVDYLIKPVSYERFLKAVTKLRDRRRFPRDRTGDFFVQTDGKRTHLRIDYERLDYIESADDYVRLHIGPATYLSHLTMKEMEAALPKQLFLRVHKSYIINLSKIASLENWQLQLTDGTMLPVGRSYRNVIMAIIRQKLVKGSQG